MREFAGKTAVVTGGASGMGLAFARRFAAEGMNVVLADIEEDALQAQVTQLQQEERSVLGVVTDTSRREAIEALLERTVAEFGNVHILCNNAGVAALDDAGLGDGPNGMRGSWDVPAATWDWVLGVNFYGVLYGCQVFIPHMLAHGEAGHIVNTASLAGLIPGGGAYGVSKHAVLALTEGLYLQFRQMGAQLSASVLCPGLVNTAIGSSERNRQEEYGGARDLSDQEMALTAMLSAGMDPNDVADLVFESIEEQRCYILPHPAWDEFIRRRVEQILERGEPVSLDPEDMARRLAAGEQL